MTYGVIHRNEKAKAAMPMNCITGTHALPIGEPGAGRDSTAQSRKMMTATAMPVSNKSKSVFKNDANIFSPYY
jgi:hypothetical protein